LPGVKCWRAMKDRNGNVGYSDKPDPKYSESAGTDGLTWVRLNDHRAAMQAYARACVSSATEALRAEVEALKRHGTLLSNIAYNLAQDDRLSDSSRWSLDDARKKWDTAIHPAAAQEGWQ